MEKTISAHVAGFGEIEKGFKSLAAQYGSAGFPDVKNELETLAKLTGRAKAEFKKAGRAKTNARRITAYKAAALLLDEAADIGSRRFDD